MKLKLLYYFLILCFPLVIISCLKDDDDDTATLNNPSFVSLIFTSNKSTPGIEKAVFTLEGDSLIVNKDSLPYGTDVTHTITQFYFTSSSSAYLFFADGDTILLTGGDTINFSGIRKESKLYNISGDGQHSATYSLKVNVHAVEGEEYVWGQKRNSIANSTGNQKAVFFNGSYYYYFVGATDVRYVISNGNDISSWENTGSISSLPISTSLWYLTVHNNELFVPTTDNRIFKSSDGTTWEEVNYTIDNNLKIHNLTFSINGNLVAIAKTEANEYYIVSSTNGTEWNEKMKVPANFPVENYSAFVFKSLLNNSKAIILGGIDASGNMTENMSWSTNDGEKWVDFGKENAKLGALAGGALVQYDKKLFLFGGMNAQNRTRENILMESKDQGLTWQIPDSAYNILPDGSKGVKFEPRSYMSAMLSTDGKEIIIIGGKEATNYADVWTGRVNKVNFLSIE